MSDAGAQFRGRRPPAANWAALILTPTDDEAP